jgi:hypothetical protein
VSDDKDKEDGTPGRTRRLNASTVIALLSLIASAVAITISVRTSNVARDAYELSARDFYGSRLPVWVGTYGKSADALLIRPRDPSFILQEATIRYAGEMSDATWSIVPPEFGAPLFYPKQLLVRRLEREIAPDYQNWPTMPPTQHLPIIIDSQYVVKGETHRDLSVYDLLFGYTRGRDNRPRVEVRGLLFRRRLVQDENPKAVLSALWNNDMFPRSTREK